MAPPSSSPFHKKFLAPLERGQLAHSRQTDPEAIEIRFKQLVRDYNVMRHPKLADAFALLNSELFIGADQSECYALDMRYWGAVAAEEQSTSGVNSFYKQQNGFHMLNYDSVPEEGYSYLKSALRFNENALCHELMHFINEPAVQGMGFMHSESPLYKSGFALDHTLHPDGIVKLARNVVGTQGYTGSRHLPAEKFAIMGEHYWGSRQKQLHPSPVMQAYFAHIVALDVDIYLHTHSDAERQAARQALHAALARPLSDWVAPADRLRFEQLEREVTSIAGELSRTRKALPRYQTLQKQIVPLAEQLEQLSVLALAQAGRTIRAELQLPPAETVGVEGAGKRAPKPPKSR